MRLRYLGLMLGRSPGEGNGYALLSSCLEDPMDGEAWRLQSVLCLAVQSCPILCDPTDYSPPGSSVHGDFPGKNTGVGYQALLHGIFPTQGWKPGLQNLRRILYPLSHREAPVIVCGMRVRPNRATSTSFLLPHPELPLLRAHLSSWVSSGLTSSH